MKAAPDSTTPAPNWPRSPTQTTDAETPTTCLLEPTSTSACRCPGRSRRARSAASPPGAIVFALANPTPEVMPEEIEGAAAIIATGRSDYPNQINHVLAFPGVFRGALDVRPGG
jgi:hypothetical protein